MSSRGEPWNFGKADDPVFNQCQDDIGVEYDEAERDRLTKEGFTYGTCQFLCD